MQKPNENSVTGWIDNHIHFAHRECEKMQYQIFEWMYASYRYARFVHIVQYSIRYKP